MSRRGKRALEDFDPNKSDSDDLDYDATERTATTPQRRRHRHAGSSKKRPSKRQRREYEDSDIVDDSDEIESDDSFTNRSSSEEPEINPTTGRGVRRTTKNIKYEESDEDEIEDPSSSEDDEDELVSRPRRKGKEKEKEKESLIVTLKMDPETLEGFQKPGRILRTRTGSKSIGRGKTPEVPSGARRSSRLSHDIETPMVALSDSGKHVNIVRQGTRSPEPVIGRATRGGKGPTTQHPSAIMEASQEASMVRDDDSSGPLDKILGGSETQVEASHEASPEHEAQVEKDDGSEDDEMEGVIQESQHEGPADDSEEDGPVTRGGRNLRVSVSSKLCESS